MLQSTAAIDLGFGQAPCLANIIKMSYHGQLAIGQYSTLTLDLYVLVRLSVFTFFAVHLAEFH